ncbi:MAG: AAA family ATPase, partial [Gammaproteobacteria bacterium]
MADHNKESEEQLLQQAESFRKDYQAVRNQVAQRIVGHGEIIDGVLTCLFVGGHALLEGVPGLGKTLLIRSLSQALSLDFNRIQFTPDLMPADITGTTIVIESRNADGTTSRMFKFQPGPIFAQIVLADEVNRATPKTQSAMLEAMQEKSVTVAGETYSLKKPFFVMATQNPIEQEGT